MNSFWYKSRCKTFFLKLQTAPVMFFCMLPVAARAAAASGLLRHGKCGKSAEKRGKWPPMERQVMASQWYFPAIFLKIPLPPHTKRPV